MGNDYDVFYRVSTSPTQWGNHRVVNMTPWQRGYYSIAGVPITGRVAWGAREAVWSNEIIYYNYVQYPLHGTYDRIVVHHTNNFDSVSTNESRQQGRGYAALGYHFFIAQNGTVYEGRPIETMGSHAGEGEHTGPLNDPDWGAIGIVMQGDFHHADNWFFQPRATASNEQLQRLEQLIVALRGIYGIPRLLMHREVSRSGNVTVCPGDHMAGHVEALRTKLSMSR